MSENNIPVVGKTQVTRGREMHWIRIDRYYERRHRTTRTRPQTYFQPVLCHAVREGPVRGRLPGRRDRPLRRRPQRHGLQPLRRHPVLLEQLPVQGPPVQLPHLRRLEHRQLKLGRNPDVTVRSRGVMEKCTFCVQRIRGAEIVAEREQPRTDPATARS